MNETASILPPEPVALYEFVITYLDCDGRRATHELQSKAAPNALASFNRAVPNHGRILGIRKVVSE